MISLKDLQNKFISDCLSGELEDGNISLAPDIDSTSISAKGRMEIYRESAIGNITSALRLTYPTVEKLVGERFFSALCRKYTEKFWPETGNMDDYGEEFASFLEEFEPAKALLYLPDMARFEWLFHKSSIADDKPIGDWQRLVEIDEDKIMDIKISLHHSVRIFYSKYPIIKIWQICQEAEDSRNTIDIDKELGGAILLVRKNMKVDIYPVNEDEKIFLQLLMGGSSLQQAFEAAEKLNAEFPFQEYFEKHIKISTFCDFKI